MTTVDGADGAPHGPDGRPVACPVCASREHVDVLRLGRLPVLINAQVRPAQAGDVALGEIRLVACHGCGHMFNAAFDADLLEYDAAYENTLHFSPTFREFAAALADGLVARHGLRGATVAELGSGPGHMLSMLCEAGAGRGLGWDPSYDAARLGAPTHPAVAITTEMFPDDGSLVVPFAYSQHVLEHLPDPVAALAAQRRAVAPLGGTVYSEVPNGELIAAHSAVWDVIYEHLSYFVPSSLEIACRRAGLDPVATGMSFGEQFLWCEAVADPARGVADPPGDSLARVAGAVAAAERFGTDAARRIDQAREELGRCRRRGPVALWGAGSKGATYLNLVASADPDAVAAVVDVNPRKHGWGVPGTRYTITAPDHLANVRPATVLVANPIYVDEIARMLAELGVDCEVRSLWT